MKSGISDSLESVFYEFSKVRIKDKEYYTAIPYTSSVLKVKDRNYHMKTDINLNNNLYFDLVSDNVYYSYVEDRVLQNIHMGNDIVTINADINKRPSNYAFSDVLVDIYIDYFLKDVDKLTIEYFLDYFPTEHISVSKLLYALMKLEQYKLLGECLRLWGETIYVTFGNFNDTKKIADNTQNIRGVKFHISDYGVIDLQSFSQTKYLIDLCLTNRMYRKFNVVFHIYEFGSKKIRMYIKNNLKIKEYTSLYPFTGNRLIISILKREIYKNGINADGLSGLEIKGDIAKIVADSRYVSQEPGTLILKNYNDYDNNI